MSVRIIAFVLFSLVSSSTVSAQNTASARNPWGMTQSQYTLYENTSVSAINALPGNHPVYGPLPLPTVSFITSQPDNGPSPNGIIAQFRFLAAPSHYLKDDPIVFPNQPGASHLHMFFGNTRADAFSDVGSGTQNDLLVHGASTVQGGKGANPSSYWVPALVDGPLNGCSGPRNIILPQSVLIYYKTRQAADTQMIPQGLELIGGNIPHTSGGGPMVHNMVITNANGGSFRTAANWGFYDPAQGLSVGVQSTIPQSNPGGYQYLRAVIGFPQCFAAEANGDFTLSSADHLSHQHMLEDGGGGNLDTAPCPSAYPNRIAKIEILINYEWPANGDVSGWRLSSDMGADMDVQVPHPGGSLHGDILFAWNTPVQKAWKDECHDPNDPRNCSIGQTGTQWILDRIDNTSTISNLEYVGNPYLADPYDCISGCPSAGTACDDGNANTINDVEDGNCNCAGSCPVAGTACNDGNASTINDVEDGNCNCAGSCPVAGTSCNDGNSNTINDIEDGNCNCAGQTIAPPGVEICTTGFSPTLDGVNNEWSSSVHPLTNVLSGTVSSPSDLTASFQTSWDNNYLYLYASVQDNSLVNDSSSPWQDDSFEIYIDGGNEKQGSYDANDHQIIVRYNDTDVHYVSGGQTNPVGIDHQMVIGSNFYNVEMRISWAFIGIPAPSMGDDLGLDVHVNDDDSGGNRDKKIAWFTTVDNSWTNPSLFRTMPLNSCVNCVPYIGLISAPIASSIHNASINIESNQVLQNGSNVSFYAEDHIHLFSGFEVPLSSNFSAEIQPCN